MILDSDYKSPYKFANPHMETMYPYFFRKTQAPNYSRKRIHLEDGDFLDLDFLQKNNDRLLLLSHGLEGNSHSKYIQGMAKYFFENAYDILAWNCRGCSGEPNNLLRTYHSGVSYDLNSVIQYVLENFSYKEIYLVGFSMGGNISLKYCADYKQSMPSEIKKVVAVSSPVHLAHAADALEDGFNKVYSRHFIFSLLPKLLQKKKQFADFRPNLFEYSKMNSLRQFDDKFTAPMNGYKDAMDYYESCSSYYILDDIEIPGLLLNAKNDPFLKGNCFPVDKLENNKSLHLELPENGGHVGFRSKDENIYWSDERVKQFVESNEWN